MKRCKPILLFMMIFAILLTMSSCGSNTADAKTDGNGTAAQSLSGTWFINSSDATIWFNDGIEDSENPASDFTVKNFNLETLKEEPNTLNATYFLEDDVFSYETYSGEIVSFNFEFKDDGSLIFTSTDSGEEITLTRKDSPGLSANKDQNKDEEEFVPDYRPGKENKYGQPNRNLASVDHSQIGIQDQWIYYSDGAGLYKMNYKTGLSSAQRILDCNAEGINVVGDWIYFGIPDANTINKVRTDGSMLQTLATDCLDQEMIYVAGDYLFYKEYMRASASEMNTYLTKMDLRTGKTERVLNDAYVFWGIGDHLYYYSGDNDQTTYCMDFNGNPIGTYPIRTMYFKYLGDRMFSGASEFFSDGSHQQLVENVHHIRASFVVDHCLYFSMKKSDNLLDSKEYGLYGYDLDSGRFWKLNSDDPTCIWAFGDGYIYYTLSDSTYVSPTYRCLPDGTGWEELENSMFPN